MPAKVAGAQRCDNARITRTVVPKDIHDPRAQHKAVNGVFLSTRPLSLQFASSVTVFPARSR